MIINFEYRNHRGEQSMRRVEVVQVAWLRLPGWGYQPGWFLVGYDTARNNELRHFALSSVVIPDPGDDYVIWNQGAADA